MKQIITLLLLLFSLLSVYGQDAADSIKRLIAASTSDSNRVFLLYKLSDEYAFSQPSIAMDYAQQALKLAKSSGFKRGQARSLTRIGNLLAAAGESSKALEIHQSALKISEDIDDQVGIAASDNNMARVYTEQKTTEGFRNALVYYEKTRKIFEMRGDHQNVCIVLLNMGDNYEKMNELDSALLYQYQAYNLAKQIQDVDNIGTIHSNLGNIYFKKGLIDSALFHYRTAITALFNVNDIYVLADAWFGLSSCFEKTGMYDSAVVYSRKAWIAGNEGENQYAVLKAAEKLSSLYSSQKKFDSAYIYNNYALQTNNALFGTEKTAAVQKMYLLEQVRQQELAEAKQKTAEEREYNLQMIAITVFIVTFFITLIMLSQKKINPKAVEILGVLGLLLVFEFILIFIHPYIGAWTHHTPVYMLIVFVIISAILGPIHHRLTKWIKEKLAHRHQLAAVAIDPESTVTEREIPVVSSVLNEVEVVQSPTLQDLNTVEKTEALTQDLMEKQTTEVKIITNLNDSVVIEASNEPTDKKLL